MRQNWIPEEEKKAIYDHSHSKLLEAVCAVGGKKKKYSERTEAAAQMSEFHVTPVEKKVALADLVGALKQQTGHQSLKKQINRIDNKDRTLNVPLHKAEQERLHRTLNYEFTKEEVSKWETVVSSNRQAEQLIFPLGKPEVHLLKSDQFIQRFKPRTPLELEVAALLSGNPCEIPKEKTLSAAEEKALKAMSLAEARLRRADLQKYRVLLSYKEAKARRQKKIKSKKYHRILRKEKQKKQVKAMEDLEKSDPEAYLERLKKIEKERAEERMSLKHRGGSTFMKQMKIFGKHDDNARQAIQEMIKQSKQLTAKRNIESSSEDEEEKSNLTMHLCEEEIHQSSSNPWLPASDCHQTQRALINTKFEEKHPKQKIEKQDKEKIQGKKVNLTRKLLQASKIKKKEKQNSYKKRHFHSDSEFGQNKDDNNQSDEEIITASLTRCQRLEDLEDEWSEEEHTTSTNVNLGTPSTSEIAVTYKINTPLTTASNAQDVQVDPEKYLVLEKRINSAVAADAITNEDNCDSDATEQHRLTIAQAFAQDDIIDEFTKEKIQTANRDKPQEVDLTLPGWGEWGGAGLHVSRKKRKRFIVKAPPCQTRKDKELTGVIISEAKDKIISKHQVNELPFPFRAVQQFEQSICAPMGKSWNPETSFKKLITPKVKTELGAVIKPLDKAQAFNKEKMKSKMNVKEEKITFNPKMKKGRTKYRENKRD